MAAPLWDDMITLADDLADTVLRSRQNVGNAMLAKATAVKKSMVALCQFTTANLPPRTTRNLLDEAGRLTVYLDTLSSSQEREGYLRLYLKEVRREEVSQNNGEL